MKPQQADADGSADTNTGGNNDMNTYPRLPIVKAPPDYRGAVIGEGVSQRPAVVYSRETIERLDPKAIPLAPAIRRHLSAARRRRNNPPVVHPVLQSWSPTQAQAAVMRAELRDQIQEAGIPSRATVESLRRELHETSEQIQEAAA